MHRFVPAGALLLSLATGCSSTVSPSAFPTASPTLVATPTAELTPSPSPALSPEPTPTAVPSNDASTVVVTFQVDDQQYRILLTEAADIAVAERLLAGDPDELATIPNGLVVRDGDGGVNDGYSWHIDPDDIEFAEVTTEICDGDPSSVAGDPVSYQRFCPWSAEVVAVDPYEG